MTLQQKIVRIALATGLTVAVASVIATHAHAVGFGRGWITIAEYELDRTTFRRNGYDVVDVKGQATCFSVDLCTLSQDRPRQSPLMLMFNPTRFGSTSPDGPTISRDDRARLLDCNGCSIVIELTLAGPRPVVETAHALSFCADWTDHCAEPRS